MVDRPKKDPVRDQLTKLQRAEEGRKAMSDYEAEAAAVRAKTERLRALRLARDAAASKSAAEQPPAVEKKARKPAAAKKRSSKASKEKSQSLAQWLQNQQGTGRRS